MRISTPTNPFHIARAYGLQQAGGVERAGGPALTRGASAPESAGPIAFADPRAASLGPSAPSGNIARLVAAPVTGRVDFAGETPRQSAAAIAMYRHPADRNAAATNVHAGRVVDVEG